MKFLKSGLILSCLALFVFACNQAANNTANNVVSNTNSNARTNSNTLANTNTPANSSMPTDEIAAGKTVFTTTCSKCHKETGTGGQVDVMGEKHTAADLTSEKVKNRADADLISTIENGEKEEGMPAFKGKLTDEQIKSVVKFIRKEFHGK
jgi:mono/diheme cytochrome c family protein